VSLNGYEMNGKYTLPSGMFLKLFRQLLVTLGRPGSSRVLRGYLYAAIIDYLTYVHLIWLDWVDWKQVATAS
jgi:hypothetical protein